MVRAKGSSEEFFVTRQTADGRLGELVALAVIAFGAIVLIAASSLSLETGSVQEMRDGEAVPIHVVPPGSR